MGKDDVALSRGAVAHTPAGMAHVDRFGSAGGRVVVVEMLERVTLAELAAVAGVHRTHLVRAFRARYGVSVGAYVRRERIRWAARALRGTETPIAEIALQAGFADQSHFTRTFVKHMGVSPGRYRRG
jgi:AraC family transcriptional regulator